MGDRRSLIGSRLRTHDGATGERHERQNGQGVPERLVLALTLGVMEAVDPAAIVSAQTTQTIPLIRGNGLGGTLAPLNERGVDEGAIRCRAVAWLFALIALASGVTSAAESAAADRGLFPPRCERRVGRYYETQGSATIDRVGHRYVLTLNCEGLHQVYVRGHSTINLDLFVGKPVHARYTYTDEGNLGARCIRAPCPPATERVLELHRLEEAPEPRSPAGVDRGETAR